MAVPDFQSFFLPLLQFSSDVKTHNAKEAYAAMAKHFKLSEDDQKEMLPSGKQTTFKNRVAWAKVYLSKALLLESPKRGIFRITERGKELLRTAPDTLRVRHLKQFPEFVDFHTSSSKQDKGENAGDEERTATPEEVFESAYQELRRSLAIELLSHVSNNSPEFFEHLVVKLLVKMGYGGSIKDAGLAIGRSGDATLAGFGVQMDHEQLIVHATPENFSLKKHNIIQAMLSVNDLFYLASPYVASLFVEDVTNWLELSDIRYTPKVKFTGKSGYDHMFDFVIPKSRKQPERIVQAVSNPNKDSAKALVFKWLDTKDIRSSDSQLFAFLNDTTMTVSQSVIDALKNYELESVLWSQRERARELLAA